MENPLKLRNTAWYPSAGEDFKPLLYLSPSYDGITGPNAPAPVEHFLFTDYWPWDEQPQFLAPGVIFNDRRTRIEVTRVEELRPMRLPVHPDLVYRPNHHHLTNRVFNLDMQIWSDDQARFARVTYAFVENTAMANDLIRKRVNITHLINVCYGSGFGGSSIHEDWLLHAAAALNTSTFISDRPLPSQVPSYCTHESARALELYPCIPKEVALDLDEIHSCRWGDHSVRWYHITNLNRF